MKIFKEKQHIRQNWLKILLTVSIVVPIIIFVTEYLKENPPMTAIGFLLTLLGISISVAFLSSSN